MNRRFSIGILLLVPILWTGCSTTRRQMPSVPGDMGQLPERERLYRHLEGTWEVANTKGEKNTARFDKSGSLTFQGLLEKHNPALWDLDADRHELRVTFPAMSNKDLQIFQLYVGNGVKSFHPNEKQVVYAFTTETWALNVGGWDYAKPDTSLKTEVLPEPTFK